MSLDFFTVIVLIVFLGWITQAARTALLRERQSWKRALNILASGCLIVGAIGFLGPSLAVSGGLNWLPESFEWPIGKATGVLKRPDGTVIVPHMPSGRIQVYDKDLRFQRGWFVESGGGIITLLPAQGEDFFVRTARGRHLLRYNVYGTLVSREAYQPGSSAPVQEAIEHTGDAIVIPTPFLLRVLASPVASWWAGAIGLLLLAFSRLGRAGRSREQPNE